MEVFREDGLWEDSESIFNYLEFEVQMEKADSYKTEALEKALRTDNAKLSYQEPQMHKPSH